MLALEIGRAVALDRLALGIPPVVRGQSFFGMEDTDIGALGMVGIG